jgi:molybdopterin/thiamine biosynthesis adenylyltransferase
MRPPPRIREIQARPGKATDAMRRLDRNARMPEVLDAAGDLGAAMRALQLAVIGCGSAGLSVADVPPRLGVGRLLLVDPAPVKAASILTHPCLPQDLGRSKAIVAGERAKAVGPDTQVFAFDGCFEELPTHVLAGTSYLLLASDNLLCEAAVSQTALHLGIPVLQASVYGRTLTAQVRSIASDEHGEGPCLCCFFGEREWEELDRGTVFSCTGAEASAAAPAKRSRIPTESLPHLCRTAADFLCMEMTRRVLGIGDADESRLVEYSGYNHRTTVTPLRRRADCSMDHARLRLAPRERDLGESAPRELLRDADYQDCDPRRVTLTIEGRSFSSLAVCRCDDHAMLGRFFATGSPAGVCPRCGIQRTPHPLHTHDEVPISALAGQLDCTLASLGATAPNSVRLRGERGAVLFHRRFPQAASEEERGHE